MPGLVCPKLRGGVSQDSYYIGYGATIRTAMLVVTMPINSVLM